MADMDLAFDVPILDDNDVAVEVDLRYEVPRNRLGQP